MPQLMIVQQGRDEKQTLPCRGPEMIIGRLPTNDVVLEHESVSRQHAKIVSEGDQYFLIDLGSNNGTMLNHALVQHHERYLLRQGDVISINGFNIHFARTDELEQSFNDITNSDIVEVKLLKKVLSALDSETHPSLEMLSGVAEGRRSYLTADAPVMVVGRDPECEWPIEEYVISRRHARLERHDKQVVISDLHSKNGTYVNNERVTHETVLRDGDRIAFGTIVALFRNPHDIDVEAVKEQVVANTPQSRALTVPERAADDYAPESDDADDLTGSESAGRLSDEELQEKVAALHYPPPKPRMTFVDRFSFGEMGLLWVGIVVFITTAIILVKMFF